MGILSSSRDGGQLSHMLGGCEVAFACKGLDCGAAQAKSNANFQAFMGLFFFSRIPAAQNASTTNLNDMLGHDSLFPRLRLSSWYLVKVS